MSRTLKKLIAVVFSGFILFLMYYGSYLPLRKSRIFISSLRNIGSVRSPQDLAEVLTPPLEAPSPIGQEELVRNISNLILDMTRQGASGEFLAQSLDFLEQYYAPIINRGKGMSFEQNLYLLGTLNEYAFLQTKNPKYFLAAKTYYLKGYELGPKRPQFLYGLFDIYRFEKNIPELDKVKNQIMAQWPDDARTKQVYDQYMQELAKEKTAKTAK